MDHIDPRAARTRTRGARRLAKPSPALVISIIALFFAISGFGIAAKNEITGKDIKDGSITAKDIAKGAIKAKHLAKRSVKSKAIAPKAVGATALAREAVMPQHMGMGMTLCPNGAIVYGYGSNCPPPPQRYAVASDVEPTQSITGPLDTCYFESNVTFDQISVYPDMRDPQGPLSAIQVIEAGFYDVTITGTWEEGGGTRRILDVSRHLGSGPNQGQHYSLERVVTTPVSGDETTQSLRFTTERLEKWDTLSVQAATCGEKVKLKKLTVNVEPNYRR